jgi:diguanylate cyclase (GGDEF)-like protein
MLLKTTLFSLNMMKHTPASILIVDDTPTNVQTLGIHLRQQNYRIYVATNGQQAIKISHESQPDLILLDISMPGMDGFEVCHHLKSDNTTKNIPIIFLTARIEPDDIVKGFDYGAADYVTKPFNSRVLLARVRTHLALRQQDKRLRELATKDGLTGIANRRYFDEFLELEWRRSLRQQQPLAVIMLDIDYFKPYNDTYGHLQGDETLKKIAQILDEKISRSSDLCARFGGEEFAIVLGNTNSQQAYAIAKELCQEIQAAGIPHQSSRVKNCPVITASLGMACMIPQQQQKWHEIIDQADKNLYLAKERGRNQVAQ